SFCEGLAAVLVGKHWGFIDHRGAVVIPPQFDDVSSFEGGLSRVVKDGRGFYIDQSGEFIRE
ncbi:MAG: WG repeat-containing protein, partial [Betaproteobacteria bacterium]